MKYRPGEVVILFSSKEVKTIVETEKIGGVEIYYMDDSTSYEKNQIFSAKNFLEKNKKKICELIVAEMDRKCLENLKHFRLPSQNG
jgi:Pyruvate/2-oxoacid:ferredoxin oxidoreductase gamma subunit